jgi:transcriptional regulator with XRE-family HTH domain
MSAKARSHIDKLVGHNIRIHRLDAGLSQTDLGKHIGVTFQQVQKYENGVNRVGSGNLFKIASALNLSVAALFQGVDDKSQRSIDDSPIALLAQPYALRLLRAFAQIDNPELRKSLVEMVEGFIADLKSASKKASTAARGKKRARK